MINLICKLCKKEFKVSPSGEKRRKFCSMKCKSKTMKGKPFFDSTGMPSWNKGIKLPYQIWNKGKQGVYSKETIEKMRQVALDRPIEEHACWKGGRRKTKGYIAVYSPEHPHKSKNNGVYEHRLVMEKHLGRYLQPNETVHHLDGDKLNNKIENLELFSSHKEHMVSKHRFLLNEVWHNEH